MSSTETEGGRTGTEYVLVGSRYTYRDDDNVLRVAKRGDKVKLTPEQADRLQAGKPGSPFQREMDVEEADLEEVAVANEATTPNVDGEQTSPERTRNRLRPATKFPEALDATATRADREDEADGGQTPEPASTTRKAGRR